jgi:hypothetical protein
MNAGLGARRQCDGLEWTGRGRSTHHLGEKGAEQLLGGGWSCGSSDDRDFPHLNDEGSTVVGGRGEAKSEEIRHVMQAVAKGAFVVQAWTAWMGCGGCGG